MQKNIALLVYYDCFDMLENALGGDDASFARAREGDNRGGVSIAFYRAILRGAAASPGAFHRPDRPAPESGYLTRKYTGADFKAMEIDLDAEEYATTAAPRFIDTESPADYHNGEERRGSVPLCNRNGPYGAEPR